MQKELTKANNEIESMKKTLKIEIDATEQLYKSEISKLKEELKSQDQTHTRVLQRLERVRENMIRTHKEKEDQLKKQYTELNERWLRRGELIFDLREYAKLYIDTLYHTHQ